MPACQTDWTPIITMICIQVPIVIGVIVNWVNLKIAQQKQRAGHDVIASKVDALTTITVNGFHSPAQNVDNSNT